MIQLLLAIIYIAFVSLGLPDELLGAAWPTMYVEMDAPFSAAGIVSMIICLGTIVSSLMSSRLTTALGTGEVTALSVGTTAVALLGFSLSSQLWMLCLWAVPYGLGAGSVDAALNNYVALHYESRHMSWLHCMWGIGATAGPHLMGIALSGGMGWQGGYRIVGVLQVALAAVLVASLPLWGKVSLRGDAAVPTDGAAAGGDPDATQASEKPARALPLRDVLRIPGALQIMVCFFCCSACEAGFSLWAASYLNLARGVDAQTAATFASIFFIGITVGRAASGFISMRLSDDGMIRLGLALLCMGVVALLVPGPTFLALSGLVVCGLGCAPIYPSIIHSTPDHFGPERSLALIGAQMASAYTGSCLMPPLFGLVAFATSVALFPWYEAAFLALMAVMHARLLKIVAR